MEDLSHDRLPSRPRGPLWALVALLFVAAIAACFKIHNLDIGLHARTGEWILTQGEIPQTNVLSEIHSTYPAVHDKWGFQVLAHGLSDGIGPDGVVVMRVIWVVLLFGILAVTGMGLGAGPLTLLPFGLLAIVAARGRFLFRPDLLSLIFLATTVWIVTVARRDGKKAFCLLLLQVLWVNIHGYFILGPMVVATVGLARLAEGGLAVRVGRRWLGLALGMCLVCLINPAGVEGALHPFRILADLRGHYDFYTSSIEEFLPTFAPDPKAPFDRTAYFALLFLSMVLVLRQTLVLRPPRLVPLALLVLFAFMSLSLRRNMAPFALVAAPLAAAAAEGWMESVARRKQKARRQPGVFAQALALGLGGLVLFGEVTDTTSIHDGIDRRWGTGVSAIAYPDRGIDFIAEELSDRSVFTAFRYGSTFTGGRWPDQIASINGNTHGYPTAYLQETLSALSGEDPLGFSRLAAQYSHDVALIPAASPLSVQLLKDPAWALVNLGRRDAVYVEKATVSEEWLEDHDVTARFLRGEGLDAWDSVRLGDVLGMERCFVPLAEIDQASLLLAGGFIKAARRRAEDALALSPQNLDALALAGVASHLDGKDDLAVDLLDRALSGEGLFRLGGLREMAAQARESITGL